MGEEVIAIGPKRKKRGATAEGCSCIDKVNELLRPRNTKLVLSMILRPEGTHANLRFRTVIATERIENLRNGKKAALVSPTFCPFCGRRYPE